MSEAMNQGWRLLARTAAYRTVKGMPWFFVIAALPAIIDGPRSWTLRSLFLAGVVACGCAPLVFLVFLIGGYFGSRAAGKPGSGRDAE